MFETLYPRRIVSLAAEVPAILQALGEFHRLVGVSAFATYPPDVEHLPRVGGFSTPNVRRILDLRPDLVITTSDIHAEVTTELVRAGVQVMSLNPHRLEDVYRNILLIGGLVGRLERAQWVVARMQADLATLARSLGLAAPVRVYFEEWPGPMVSGIGWVSDLIHLLGGEDIFRDRAMHAKAAQRVVTPELVRERQPDVIFLSWCGKPADTAILHRRPGWKAIPAVRENRIFEIPSDVILQAGPQLIEGARMLADGLRTISQALHAYRQPIEE
ncbi:MAG: cobalamin-binding protein [Ardenticatenia bacterium]|nr:MAG: cobalamin-binding protein [Ardenticatenia bacterium]